MTKLAITYYNSEQVYPDELSVDEVLSDEPGETSTKDPRLQIIALHDRIQMLKDVSSKFLIEIKQCRKSFNDASVVVGELNGNFKKFK